MSYSSIFALGCVGVDSEKLVHLAREHASRFSLSSQDLADLCQDVAVAALAGGGWDADEIFGKARARHRRFTQDPGHYGVDIDAVVAAGQEDGAEEAETETDVPSKFCDWVGYLMDVLQVPRRTAYRHLTRALGEPDFAAVLKMVVSGVRSGELSAAAARKVLRSKTLRAQAAAAEQAGLDF